MIERIQSALPELQIQSIRSYEEGWDFYVLEVNEEWIFRFPRRPQEIERLKREASFLEQVASDLPVDAPRYEVLHLREPLPFGGVPEAYRNCAYHQLLLFHPPAGTGTVSQYPPPDKPRVD